MLNFLTVHRCSIFNYPQCILCLRAHPRPSAMQFALPVEGWPALSHYGFSLIKYFQTPLQIKCLCNWSNREVVKFFKFPQSSLDSCILGTTPQVPDNDGQITSASSQFSSLCMVRVCHGENCL